MSVFGTQKLFGVSQPSPFATAFSAASQPTASFSGFNFGATHPSTQTQGSLLIGTSQPTTTGSLFSTIGSTASPFQAFGTTTPKTTASLFPSLFTSVTTQSGLFGTQQQPFGLATSFTPAQQTVGSFAQTQGVLQPTTQQAGLDAFFASLCQPLLFGDERDTLLARWNQLQAMWGTGVGFSSMGMATYTSDNTFARFKAIAYNLLPTSTDADGLVCLYLSRPFSEVIPQKQGLQDVLFRLLGSRANLQLIVEEIRPCVEQEIQTEVILKVVERQATGHVTNIHASELQKYLSSPTVAAQLQSQLCVCKIVPEVRPSASQLAVYRENPPAGIDPLIWQQACIDNPHPDRMIPIPLIGFADLRRRKLDQVAFGRQQSHLLKQIGETVQAMKAGQPTILQKLAQLKRRQVEIRHRVLKVLRRQEVHRRAGFAISVEEEALRCGLERIWSELTAPRGLRVRFQEVLSTFHTNSESSVPSNKENNVPTAVGPVRSLGVANEDYGNWNLDADSWAELKDYLVQRQNGIRELQHLVGEMSASLKIMEDNPVGSMTAASTLPLLIQPRATPNKVSFALNTPTH